ncbi:hypothetical protein BS17DRAFT_826619 [Gyrodon lividus]|nr:hypothetical protein BS17DRAFT_826619 [Gyrodon lividus]
MQAANENRQQVIEHLIAAWEADHNGRVDAWNLWHAAKVQAAEGEEHAQRELEIKANCLADEEVVGKCKKAEKKPRMNDFEESASIPSIIVPHPSQKLSSFEHVNLYYFSLAGCTEASKYNMSNMDDAFGISKTDDVLTLHSVTSVKVSCNSVQDNELSFKTFLQARNNFLYYAKKVSWPSKHLNTLAEFSWNIEMHPMQTGPNGNTIILTYVVRAQQNWHNALKANKAFNISIINEFLM